MKKTYVWTLPTRLFHIAFAVMIVIAFVTADSDRLLNIHAIVGYSIIILIAFRLLWFIMGPLYSRWKDMTFSIKACKDFMLNIFNSKQEYIGHNPMASWVMVSMIFLTLLIIVSGVFAFGIQESQGPLAFLNTTFFKKMELFEEMHETLASVLIALVVIHLGGIMVDKLLHGKMQTVQSIVNGYKQTEDGSSATLNWFQKVVAIVFLLLFVSFLAFNVWQPNNVLVASSLKQTNFQQEYPLFANECGSCHILYPPSLLPKKSWEIMMSQLDNHFGDDASLDAKDEASILHYLVSHAAEDSTSEASHKIITSLTNKDIIAISDTVYWKNTHKDIPKDVFQHSKVRSKSNCKACHLNIEQGVVLDENIQNLDRFN